MRADLPEIRTALAPHSRIRKISHAVGSMHLQVRLPERSGCRSSTALAPIFADPLFNEIARCRGDGIDLPRALIAYFKMTDGFVVLAIGDSTHGEFNQHIIRSDFSLNGRVPVQDGFFRIEHQL